jgi:hypothetical protein
MTAALTSPLKPEQQTAFCLFTPVANSVSKSRLQFKLTNQFKKQSQLVPPVPLSLDKAIKGPITHWLPSYIEDKLYLEMCETEIADPNSPDDKISRYYLEAAKYAGRISAGNFDGENAKYKPVFQIHYKDFTRMLQDELQQLLKESPITLASVVENTVFRIFKARHKRIFFEYIESQGLNWRFVAAD